MRFMDNLDLLKSKRDKSKLVQVQRSVSRGGKTFPQIFWVKPTEVKATDKVVGGQQNLLPKAGSVPKPASGVLDKIYFDSIKSDKTKALDYLKSCGITWNEHSHSAINWMRAMQAYNIAIGGQGVQKPVKQGNIQSGQVSVQNGQSPQPAKDIKTVTLTQTQQDEVNSGKNGKEKTVILKKLLGNDGCIAYAKQLGVTWDENQHPAINIMRMSVALKEHFDKVDGTVSPSGKVKTSKNNGGGAPVGNQNAKKDTVKKDDTLLKIPDTATEREKNIITLLNSISDEKELETYKSVGMIPEDDVSKSFITDKLAPKYDLWRAAHAKKTVSSTKNRYNSNNNYGFADQMTHDLKVEGCKKDVIGNGYKNLYDNFHMGLLVDPREFISTQYKSRINAFSLERLMLNMRDFSNYSTDKYDQLDIYGNAITQYSTNLGYTGWDKDELIAQYDLESEGFVRVLRKIAEDDPSLADQCDKTITKYDELMETVDRNPNLLQQILTRREWDNSEPEENKRHQVYYSWAFETPGNAAFSSKIMKTQIENIPKALKSLGYSDEDIESALYHSFYNYYLEDFEVRKADGTVDTVNLLDAVDESGIPYFEKENRPTYERVNSDVLQACLEQFSGKDHKSSTWQRIKRCDAIASVSPDAFRKVHKLSTELFGLKYVDMISGSDIDMDTVDVTSYSVRNPMYDCDLEKADVTNSSEFDKVMANLLMTNLSVMNNKEISYRINDNASSSVNGNGKDYTKNFSYYSGLLHNEDNSANKRYKGAGAGLAHGDTYSGPQEISDIVSKQLKNVPTFSSEYIDNVTSYYTAVANYGSPKSEARKANFRSVGINLKDYKDSPLKDILFTMSSDMLQYIPTMTDKYKGVTGLKGNIAKKMDYVPYDFTTSTQKTLSELNSKPKKQSKTKADNQLKTLRQEALKAVHCTIAVEDEATSLQMRKEFMKNWDYDGISHPKIYSGSKSYMGADRRALFNSRFFKVKNTNFEQPFKDYCTETGQTPVEHYHATSYASTAGILGHDGAWNVGKTGYVKVAQALGAGAYFGKKGGKSSVYCGEGSGGYHDLKTTGSDGDNANGCYILTSLIQGKPQDTTVCDSFREYEIVVRNNKCLLPHHFVDISCRNLGVNVQRDAKGNYLDKNGNITHDKYGKSVTMK